MKGSETPDISATEKVFGRTFVRDSSRKKLFVFDLTGVSNLSGSVTHVEEMFISCSYGKRTVML